MAAGRTLGESQMSQTFRAGKMFGASIAALTLTAACSAVGGPLANARTSGGSSSSGSTSDMVRVKGESVPHNSDASGNSKAEADVSLVRDGDYVTVTVTGKRSAPGLVHAQHIHGPGLHECPTIGADANHDGLIDTSEGLPDYGPIVVSLTTTGDTSPKSGLAVDRFPVADANGNYTYERKLHVGDEIPMAIADHLTDFHVVSHGIDTNHNGAYDFSKGPSDLDPTLPQEATVPASCGLIENGHMSSDDHDDMNMDHGMMDMVRVKGESVPHNSDASGNSKAEADVSLVRDGDYVTVTVTGKRSAPGLVHAQHIHGPGLHECPTIGADANHDGLIDTSEGLPDYGPIVVSLTTTGDTSPKSGLAVDRFPVADANGNYTYERKLHVGDEIPMAIADHLTDFHVVSHGIDTNHNGAYDFSKGPSDLDPTLPQEATVPASCGLIK